MKKQHSNEMQSIRKKLLAAIAMLLVAVIMTVSSTYAWFTLSTAPEVKGITTTVGANGNLEIALGTYETVYGSETPGANEGDSMAVSDVKEANITWGNLVDVTTGYGLDKIKLYPTRLNANGNALNAFSPLQYAIYGTDGRVAELSGNTTLGTVNSTGEGFETMDTINFAGVNAIGSVSDISPRQFAERNYRNAIDGYRVSAQSEAKGAISLYAGALAELALDYQGGSSDATVAPEKIEILNNLITKLEKANDNIGKSLKSAALLSITCVADLSDAGWETVIATASDDAYTISDIIANLGSLAGAGAPTLTLPSAVTDVVDKHEAIATLLDDAKDELSTAAEDDTYTWGEVSATVGELLNKTGILICGQTIEAIAADKDVQAPGGAFEQVTTAVLNGGLKFEFDTGSGVFADIADLTGKYSTSIKFADDFKVEGIKIGTKPWPVEVKSASSNADKGDLGNAYTLLESIHAPATSDPSVAKALTDTYGYTVDMIFRTNATDSFLQLQTEAANRIYEGDESNAGLMGGGSNMSFTVSPEYNATKIKGIADGIRVVFYESTTTTANIIGVAGLDTTAGRESGDQYILDLKLKNYTIGSNGRITITGDKADASICALTANTAKKITALVYLDGDVIDNSDVGLVQSLDGKLNLQFSSSATLTPMVNNTLLNTVNG